MSERRNLKAVWPLGQYEEQIRLPHLQSINYDIPLLFLQYHDFFKYVKYHHSLLSLLTHKSVTVAGFKI